MAADLSTFIPRLRGYYGNNNFFFRENKLNNNISVEACIICNRYPLLLCNIIVLYLISVTTPVSVLTALMHVI